MNLLNKLKSLAVLLFFSAFLMSATLTSCTKTGEAAAEETTEEHPAAEEADEAEHPNADAAASEHPEAESDSTNVEAE